MFALYERFYFYDTVWACALALNKSIQKLYDLGKYF